MYIVYQGVGRRVMVRIVIMRVKKPYLIGQRHGEDHDHEGEGALSDW